MLKKNIIKMLGLASALLSVSAFANNNFNCPASEEIQSTNFTEPSIWIAPPMAHSAPDVVGVGFGGKTAGKLIGVEKTKINGGDGWVCVYKSKGATTLGSYYAKIKKILVNNKFLIKYIDGLNEAFDNVQPFLKHYPKNEELGFVGYKLESQDQQQRKK